MRSMSARRTRGLAVLPLSLPARRHGGIGGLRLGEVPGAGQQLEVITVADAAFRLQDRCTTLCRTCRRRSYMSHLRRSLVLILALIALLAACSRADTSSATPAARTAVICRCWTGSRP